jgi:hypothetical protein
MPARSAGGCPRSLSQRKSLPFAEREPVRPVYEFRFQEEFSGIWQSSNTAGCRCCERNARVNALKYTIFVAATPKRSRKLRFSLPDSWGCMQSECIIK